MFFYTKSVSILYIKTYKTVNNLSKYVYEAFKFRLTNTVDINV